MLAPTLSLVLLCATAQVAPSTPEPATTLRRSRPAPPAAQPQPEGQVAPEAQVQPAAQAQPSDATAAQAPAQPGTQAPAPAATAPVDAPAEPAAAAEADVTAAPGTTTAPPAPAAAAVQPETAPAAGASTSTGEAAPPAEEGSSLSRAKHAAARKRAEARAAEARAEAERRTQGPPHRFYVTPAVRLGLGMPAGEYKARGAGPVPLELAVVHGRVMPLWLEAQAWVTRRLSFGPYVQLGPTTSASVCPDCGGSLKRLGLGAAYAFPIGTSPVGSGPIELWLGGSAGYEWLSFGYAGGRASYSGVEHFALQGGADLPLFDKMELGPFFTVTTGSYAREGARVAGVSTTQDILRPSRHHWFFLGVRARFLRPAHR